MQPSILMVHDDLCCKDFIVIEIYVTTTTIATNGKWSALVEAQEVFDQCKCCVSKYICNDMLCVCCM